MKNNERIMEENNRIIISNNSLMVELKYLVIDSLFKVFPHSNNDTLQRLYGFFTSTENVNLTLNGLINIESIEDIYLKEEEELIELYDPSDYMWYVIGQNGVPWLWHLKNIQADLAWDITKGDPSVKIAILDTWFDINHPDLYNQLFYHYDPYDNQPFYSDQSQNNHGTTVASFAAAETDGGGQLASIGFNCKIIPYKAQAGNYLQRAQHASLVMNADIITSSAGGWSCPTTLNFNTYDGIAVREILNNGTVIVMPAGNGENGAHCKDLINNQHQPSGPLHPYYDERIIIVTSTDKDDNHTYIKNGIDHTHSHYPYVDICSPGYNTMGATSTLLSDGTPSNWPYYGSCTGTSVSTPIVAGVCALLKSINKCFTPEDIKHIIKMTADPVADAHLYQGKLGAGRINAFKSVNICYNGLPIVHGTITQNTTWNTDVHAIGTITIPNNVTLSITSTVKCDHEASILIHPGGKLILDGGTLTNACNGEMWQGVTVMGDPNLPSSTLYQGYVQQGEKIFFHPSV